MNLVVDGQAHEIETKPVTLVCPSPGIGRIEYPKDTAVIGPDETIRHTMALEGELHPRWREGFEVFCKGCSHHPPPVDIELAEIRNGGDGLRHIAGLIDLSLKALDVRARVVWRYPESFLHPAWQVALGDLVIWLTQTQETQECSR